MGQFSATTESTAMVAAERKKIWDVLTDPVLLPKLTPLLTSIDTDGDLWRWHMVRIAALGVSVIPAFTEKMVFDEGKRIDYSHQSPVGAQERAGADGWYVLKDVEGGTELSIKLTLHVELPLPRAASPAVTRIMKATMIRTGDKFAANLLDHLGVPR